MNPTIDQRVIAKRAINIIEAITDPRLIGDSISLSQGAAAKSLYGLPLLDDELFLYRIATEREVYVAREYREGSFTCGRRSGKSSKLAANFAIFEAVFRQHKLAPGERGHVVVIATTKKQAAVVFDYILARLENSPTLHKLIDGEPRADEVDLTNNITIAVWTCSFRSIRGISIVCAICDEIAFWHDDVTGANPATEVLRAIRPAMATFPTAKLIKISSPYAKQGIVWDDWQARHKRDDLLVWRLDSATMNPTLDAEFLAAEQRRDPEFFAREYLAEFWESASQFLPAEMVDAAIVPSRFELTPQPDIAYTAALDSAFRVDNFAFAVAHRTEQGRIVQDVARCWLSGRGRPVNLAATLEEIVSILNRFGISTIYGDQHCAEPIRQALRDQGIDFQQRTTLGHRSQCFNSLRSLVTSGQIELLDLPEQTAELKKLEQIVAASGNQRIEATSGHDDRAVALALAAHEAVATPTVEPWIEVLRVKQSERGGFGRGGSTVDEGNTRWHNIN